MTKASLLIMHKNALLEAGSKTKLFKLEKAFLKKLILYLVKNNIRIDKTEKL